MAPTSSCAIALALYRDPRTQLSRASHQLPVPDPRCTGFLATGMLFREELHLREAEDRCASQFNQYVAGL
jgi:hypothetical protein